jgi:hypothetical protein
MTAGARQLLDKIESAATSIRCQFRLGYVQGSVADHQARGLAARLDGLKARIEPVC